MTGVGRPKLPNRRRRDIQIGVRLKPEEHDEVKRQAKAADMTVAEWVRSRIVGNHLIINNRGE